MWPFSTGRGSDDGGKRKADAPAAPHPLPPGVTSGDTCPVDESTRQAWLDTQRQSQQEPKELASSPLVAAALPGKVGETSAAGQRRAAMESQRASALSKSREVSSIPRAGESGYNGGEGDGAAPRPPPTTPADVSSSPGGGDATSAQGSNWVYPSPAQFYSAMERKNHNPSADDMPIVVSIHNAVNERAWQEIVAWERGWLGSGSQVEKEGRRRREPAEECGGLKLVSFTGKPHQLTWRAWGRTLLGYQAPFDRHDWIVDRCGSQVRYIIDFYTGRPNVAARTSPTGGPVQNVAFYLDVRPAPDTAEGWAMRAHRTWLKLTGSAPAPGAA
ncbi:hypothetical protein CF319_g4437 [Tilletia indica]|uniref:Holocytochrome c-type synthase n=1 Tax=Tilletia indica TaxID=43049 RepID=A0A177TGK7_9BASI|nr:hypothetical protein CF319_g4437 [Tilletia indica]KAE8259639.1 hypothetical protein A4X13_0g868 [Tilletia indica]